MGKLFVIKVGTTYPSVAAQYGDFDAWTLAGLKVGPGVARVVDAERGGELPPVAECGGAVITGSHAMVTDRLPWSERVADWIRSLVAAEVPFLGICYGHQLLAHATGGEAGFHPRGKEIGTVAVDLAAESAGDPLLGSMPPHILAHTTHAQAALKLPPGAIRLAGNAFEPNHAFRLGRSAWGVQFHPEYDARIMAAYIREQAGPLRAAGHDVEALLRSVQETPHAAEVLAAFGRVAGAAASR